MAEKKGRAEAGSVLRDLAPRVVSALVMAAAALGTLWRGGDVFLAFWCLVATLVLFEWQTIVGGSSMPWRVALGGVAIAGAVLATRAQSPDLVAPPLAAGLVANAWLAGPGRRWWAASGVLYAGSLAISLAILRRSLDGFEVVVWLFAVVWGTDVMAYFGGRLIGGPKLWSRVSPSKTWAGLLVGIGSGALIGLAGLAMAGGLSPGSWIGLMGLGLATAAVSQGGDLFESSLKRRFGVKDSGHLIPGHGGFMDRLDGFIAAAVFVAIVGALRVGPLEVAMGVLRW